MSGFITKIEVEANKEFIVSSYGVEFYDACLVAEGQTFLGLLIKFGKI